MILARRVPRNSGRAGGQVKYAGGVRKPAVRREAFGLAPEPAADGEEKEGQRCDAEHRLDH